MASPQFGVAYSFNVILLDSSAPGRIKLSPLISAGDFRISKDNGPLVNLATVPVETPVGSGIVVVSLTATEMQCAKLSLVFSRADFTWGDGHYFLDIPQNTLDALSGHFPEGIRRGVPFPNYAFTMVTATDPATLLAGLTVTAQRRRDAETAFVACDNAVVPGGNGAYRIDLTANDLNATVLQLLFTATNARAKMQTYKLSP